MKQFSTEQRAKKLSKESMMTTSLAAMVLCCILFVGSTFAWYTDTVSTSSTTIEAGEIRIEVSVAEDPAQPLPAAGESGFFYPGAVEPHEGSIFRTKPIIVTNSGSLDAKVAFSLSDNANENFSFMVVPKEAFEEGDWSSMQDSAVTGLGKLAAGASTEKEYYVVAKLDVTPGTEDVTGGIKLSVTATGNYSQAWQSSAGYDLTIKVEAPVSLTAPLKNVEEDPAEESVQDPAVQEEPAEEITENPAEEASQEPIVQDDPVIPTKPEESEEEPSTPSEETSQESTEEPSEETPNE